MNKELEEIKIEAIKYIENRKKASLHWIDKFKERKDIEEITFKHLEKIFLKDIQIFDYILEKLQKRQVMNEALDNSISKEVIEKKIEELKENVKDFEKTDNTGRFKKTRCIDYYKLEALQELLEGK